MYYITFYFSEAKQSEAKISFLKLRFPISISSSVTSESKACSNKNSFVGADTRVKSLKLLLLYQGFEPDRCSHFSTHYTTDMTWFLSRLVSYPPPTNPHPR